MKINRIVFTALVLAVSPLVSSPVSAEGDLSRANVQTVTLEMGTNDKGMYFKPSTLSFKTGQAYKLVLKNVDPVKHEVESHGLVERVFTRKVEVKDKEGGLVAEIKGNVREIELGPMAEVEWYFVPIQPGKDLEMTCALAGHKEAGMHGMINIE